MTSPRPASAVSTPAVAPMDRVTAIDALRGFVMVLMALDHTREFFTSGTGNPLNPQSTTFWLFATRWITHLCAPVFVFVAGVSIYLLRQRRAPRELTRVLLTRGLWLVIVDLTLVHLVFNFHWQWKVQLFEVIWVIGASMMIMAALIHCSVRTNLLFGALLVLGHNALDPLASLTAARMGWVWNLLHVPGLLTGPPVHPPIVLVAYPLLPWPGVMALGYAFGSILRDARPQRIRFARAAGILMLAGFFALRASNLYGDPGPWTVQAGPARTLFSFLNVQKYPPSLLFLLVTLGLAALLFAAIEWAETSAVATSARRILRIYGRVPFFYFLLHIAVIHLLALLTTFAAGGNWRWWLAEFPQGGVLAGHPPGYGYGLPVVWGVWIAVVVLCYPACRWYAGVRQRHVLLSYF